MNYIFRSMNLYKQQWTKAHWLANLSMATTWLDMCRCCRRVEVHELSSGWINVSRLKLCHSPANWWMDGHCPSYFVHLHVLLQYIKPCSTHYSCSWDLWLSVVTQEIEQDYVKNKLWKHKCPYFCYTIGFIKETLYYKETSSF